jgi:hypothetical protein
LAFVEIDFFFSHNAVMNNRDGQERELEVLPQGFKIKRKETEL